MQNFGAEGVARASFREWMGLAVLALPCMLYSMDLTVLHLAVPKLTAELRPSSLQLLWIVDIYGFILAGTLITMSTLGDRIGRRRLLLTGAFAFGAASLFAAFASSAEMLIAARALLGLAAATLAPSTLSLLRNMFHDPEERAFAFGVWIASFSAGAITGPLLGGLLLEYFWWGSVFLLNVPIMIALLILGPVLLPEFRDPGAGRLDVLSAILSIVSVLSIIYGVKKIAEGWLGLTPALSLVAGFAIGIIFIRRQQILKDPLIDLHLFRLPGFSPSLAAGMIACFISYAAYLFIAQYLQLVLGLSPIEAGLWSAPSAVAAIASSLLAPSLARKMRPAYVIACGFLTTATGLAILTQAGGESGLAIAVSAEVIISSGLSPVFTMTTNLIMGTAPPERAGVASGLSETSSEFGGALGIAILGSLVTALYRHQIAADLPADIPVAVAEAARASLGGAVAVSASLPNQTGVAMLEAAHLAFTDAVVLTSVFSATLAITAAVIAGPLLRQVQRPSPPEDEAAS